MTMYEYDVPGTQIYHGDSLLAYKYMFGHLRHSGTQKYGLFWIELTSCICAFQIIVPVNSNCFHSDQEFVMEMKSLLQSMNSDF